MDYPMDDLWPDLTEWQKTEKAHLILKLIFKIYIYESYKL